MTITLNGSTGITTPADAVTGNATIGGTLTVGGVNAVAVAPGANGNVLTSNGTAWTSAAPATSGVSSLAAGSGISVSGSTGAVTVANTGVTSLTAGSNITLSGSTGAVTINAASSGGSVTSVATGTGLTGGTITTSGTISMVTTAGALGTYAFLYYGGGGVGFGTTAAGSSLTTFALGYGTFCGNQFATFGGSFQNVSGTWQSMSNGGGYGGGLWMRIA